MYENTVLGETFPDRIIPEDKFDKLQSQFINTISENKLSIAQVRYLFNSIMYQFEVDMPVTNHTV